MPIMSPGISVTDKNKVVHRPYFLHQETHKGLKTRQIRCWFFHIKTTELVLKNLVNPQRPNGFKSSDIPKESRFVSQLSK